MEYSHISQSEIENKPILTSCLCTCIPGPQQITDHLTSIRNSVTNLHEHDESTTQNHPDTTSSVEYTIITNESYFPNLFL